MEALVNKTGTQEKQGEHNTTRSLTALDWQWGLQLSGKSTGFFCSKIPPLAPPGTDFHLKPWRWPISVETILIQIKQLETLQPTTLQSSILLLNSRKGKVGEEGGEANSTALWAGQPIISKRRHLQSHTIAKKKNQQGIDSPHSLLTPSHFNYEHEARRLLAC